MPIALFGKKKPNTAPTGNSEPPMATRLQEIVGGDGELYQVMSRLLFLDPKKITTPLESAVNQAAEFESSGNKIRAEVWYRIAGGISLYKGDVEGVRKFFEKASSIAGDSRPEYRTILKRAAEAVSIAKKFYEVA